MRERRIGVALVRMGLGIGRFGLASEHHLDAAFRGELHHHVRALVGRPDIVVLVDPHGVGVGPGVEIFADLT
jgi:hypothetical protein